MVVNLTINNLNAQRETRNQSLMQFLLVKRALFSFDRAIFEFKFLDDLIVLGLVDE